MKIDEYLVTIASRCLKLLVLSAGALILDSAQANPISGQGTWEITLQARDINRDGVADAYYDSALNITWLADWFAEPQADWNTQKAWASNLNVFGVTGWRLPIVSPVNGTAFQYGFSNNGSADSGFAETGIGWGFASELGHMYYVTLGNKGECTPDDVSPMSCVPQPGWGRGNTGPFNIWDYAYWTGNEYAPDPSRAWYVNFYNGSQSATDLGFGKSNTQNAVAVYDGDIAAIPEPDSFTMIVAGLALLVLVSQGKRTLRLRQDIGAHGPQQVGVSLQAML